MKTLSRVLPAALLFSFLLFTSAFGQIVVNTLSDASTSGDGDCSLREAIANVNFGADQTSGDCLVDGGTPDTVAFSVTGVISLSAALTITYDVVIDGPGANSLSLSGRGVNPVAQVQPDLSTVEFRDLTLQDGYSDGAGGAINFVGQNSELILRGVHVKDSEADAGGALSATTGNSTITVINSTFSGNHADRGGAIRTLGPMHVVNGTFSGNTATIAGGAIEATGAGAIVELDNATIVYNAAADSGGGLNGINGGNFAYKNSIIAGNGLTGSSGSTKFDCAGESSSSEDYNVLGLGTGCNVGGDVETNAVHTVVDTLDNNGGGIPTHALVMGSPALDAGATKNGGTVLGGCDSIDNDTIGEDARGDARAQGPLYGGSVCDIGAFEAQIAPNGLQTNLTVFLQGPYAGGGLMNAGPAVPYLQPFGDPAFDGTLLDYDGPEVIGSNQGTFGANVVDWVLVTLLQTGSVVAQQAAFVFIDGSVLTADFEHVKFTGVSKGTYDIVVAHRNHIPIQSASGVVFTTGTGVWNFTTGMAQAYSGGGAPMKDLGSSKFGMFACDANADGIVTAPDFNIWNASTSAGDTGYVAGDCNLDGIVTAPDFNIWNANTTAGAASQVP